MRSPFVPALHGFAFSNSFTNHVIRIPALGIDVTTAGRCGGMAYAALDYWHNGMAVPEDSSLPADGTVLADYIYIRLLDSMVANGAHFFANMTALDHPTALRGKGVARDTREDQYPSLQASLNAGEPRVLGLCQARDVAGLGRDHQVVAIGYEDDGTTSTVFIYDNNYPGRVCSLRFKSAYDPGDRAVHHSQGADYRSFFIESYAPRQPEFLSDGHLLSEASDPAIHLVRGGGRFRIPSPQEFDALDLDWNQVQETADGSLAHVASHPGDGTLIRERTNAEIGVVYGGCRFPIPSPDIFNALGLDWNQVRTIPNGTASGLRAQPRDETLLKIRTAPEIFVVRSGQLRWIPNPETFTAQGFNWANVRTVPETAIDLIPRGSDLPDQAVPPPPVANILRVTVEPARQSVGSPVQVVVRAVDDRSGNVVAGEVFLDGVRVAATDTPFTYTFKKETRRVFDPDTRTWEQEIEWTTGEVRAPSYDSAAIPLELYQPAPPAPLRVAVSPGQVFVNHPATITVTVTDPVSGQPTAASVQVDGVTVGQAGVPFSFTFASTAAQVRVVPGGGRPSSSVPLVVAAHGRLRVSVEPARQRANTATQLLVRVSDDLTGAPVAGDVYLDGARVAATNTAFTATLKRTTTRTFDPDTKKWETDITETTGEVRAPTYPQPAPIPLNF